MNENVSTEIKQLQTIIIEKLENLKQMQKKRIVNRITVDPELSKVAVELLFAMIGFEKIS